MKILVLSNLYPPHEIGGYELRCRDIVERLAERGHNVKVLTSDHYVPGRSGINQPHVDRHLRINGMYGHSWLPIHKLRELEKHNHQTLELTIREFEPDLIHIWNMGGVSKSLLHRLEAGNIPVVYDISDHWIARSLRADVWLSWWNAPGSAARSAGRALLSATGIRSYLNRHTPTNSWNDLRFEHIYFCSAFMRDHTASKNWPVSHAEVIHCGIDTRAFTVKSDYSQFSKLMWVGRIADDKDPFTALRALAAARRQGLEVTLDLYGNGTDDDLHRLESEIDESGMREFANRRSAPAEEMRRLYAQYDALLFTSNWGEPFALTPLEASAAGLPVISSLDGGQAELVRDGENMIEATAADPESYARGINRLAHDAALRQQLATTSLHKARKRFDVEVITDQIEALLNRVLSIPVNRTPVASPEPASGLSS